jgi:hypothetical protein
MHLLLVGVSIEQLVSLIVPHNDTEVFQTFLETMATEVLRAQSRFG